MIDLVEYSFENICNIKVCTMEPLDRKYYMGFEAD